MANLFIGFPVPRAKIADMIEGSAPPLEHVSNHLPSGSDPIVLPGDIETDDNVQWNGTKFIGTAAAGNGVVLSPMSIHSSVFIPQDDQTDYHSYEGGLRRRADLGAAYFHGPVSLPHGVTVTKLILYGYRTDAAASLELILRCVTNSGSVNPMATISADWTDGNNSKEETSIGYATVNNSTYSYYLYAHIHPNDDVWDVILRRAVIEFS